MSTLYNYFWGSDMLLDSFFFQFSSGLLIISQYRLKAFNNAWSQTHEHHGWQLSNIIQIV